MGQSESVEALQRSISKDFSDRVLVLHGLFSSPYPFGSHLLCQVDLKDADDLNEAWNVENVEIVIQVINYHPNERAIPNLTGFSKHTNSHDADREIERQPKVIQSHADKVEPDQANENCVQFQRAEEGKPSQSTEADCSEGQSFNTNSLDRTSARIIKQRLVAEKLLSSLAPELRIVPASYQALQELVSRTKYELKLEEVRDSTLQCGVEASSFESLHGHKCTTRHPNIVPIIGAFEGDNLLYIVYPLAPYTLETLLYFSPSALQDDGQISLIAFQLFSALAHCHSLGVSHGNIKPSNLLLTKSLWCWLTGFSKSSDVHKPLNLPYVPHEDNIEPPFFFSTSETPYAVPKSLTHEMLHASEMMDFRVQLRKWWAGELSNFDYLLHLNKLAGRRWGDRCFHTVMPWVIDFSVKPGDEEAGWRNLSKSKWRLAKGDEQLDFTYSTAEIPHHVSDECLSELAVCIYKARRFPLRVLRKVVRSVYEPNEYPASMQRLFQWTPDECIPEFYCDPSVFESIHPGMSNLAVPDWATDPKEFIALHRAALESEHVSSKLHHWIDLTFGYKLSGEAAIVAKNVPLSTTAPGVLRSMGRRQLFVKPHPCKSTSLHFNFSSSLKHHRGDQNLKDGELQPSPVTEEKWKIPKTEKLLKSAHKVSKKFGFQRSSYASVLAPLEPLEQLEQCGLFCEHGRHLSPCYKVPICSKQNELSSSVGGKSPSNAKTVSSKVSSFQEISKYPLQSTKTNLQGLKLELVQNPFEGLRVARNEEINYQDFVAWKMEVVKENTKAEVFEDDIFAAGCIIAELYLQHPLFDPMSASAYAVNGTLPKALDSLPLHARLLVETTLQKSSRRPTAQMLLESPFFPASTHSVYNFLSTLECFSTEPKRWEYITQKCQEGAFQCMGPIAAEKCALSCFSLITPPYQSLDAGAVVNLLHTMLQSLKPHASKYLLVPLVQRLLQSNESGQLKLGMLQSSFMRSLCKVLGTSVYIQQIHPSIFGNILLSDNQNYGTAASAVVVETCLDLGLPITLHQIFMPLLQMFGRDITKHGIKTLVEVGMQFGEKVVLKHLLPPLRSILMLPDSPGIEITGPGQSWHLLAVVDALTVLDHLILILSPSSVVTELLQDPNNLYKKILQQLDLHPTLSECTAKAILALCMHVGPDATSTFVLPQLKQVFDEVAFSGAQQLGNISALGKANISPFLDLKDKSERTAGVEMLYLRDNNEPHNDGSMSCVHGIGKTSKARMNLVHVLYPSLASILGIEKLRQCLPTWLLLEQYLLRHYGWKWEAIDAAKSHPKQRVQGIKASLSDPVFDPTPANMLLNGVGWSIPQSLAHKWGKSSNCHNQSEDGNGHISGSNVYNNGAWSWVPVANDNWGTSEAFTRLGATMGIGKDESSWKLNAAIVHSWKAQNGMLKSAIVDDNECEIYTAGGGSRNRSTIRRWKLSSIESNFEYMGHEETVHDICILREWGKVASCDGTLHIWSPDTGERTAIFGEPGTSALSHSMSAMGIMDGDKTIVSNINGAGTSSGILSAGWGGNLYTYMCYLEADARLLVGTTNGSIIFFDIKEGRRLFSWRCEPLEIPLASYVSAICSTGRDGFQEKQHLTSSWIAAGFSSGFCSILDYRSGSVITHWRAHGVAVTKMRVLDDHYVLSSSLDRTLRIWDLRRSLPMELQLYQGHTDGITSFSLWNNNILSVAGSRIGLSSLPNMTLGEHKQPKQYIKAQKLYTADHSSRNMAAIVTLSVLPFSHLFIVGTDDGFLKICQ